MPAESLLAVGTWAASAPSAAEGSCTGGGGAATGAFRLAALPGSGSRGRDISADFSGVTIRSVLPLRSMLSASASVSTQLLPGGRQVQVGSKDFSYFPAAGRSE